MSNLRSEAARKLRLSARLAESAKDHWQTGDELMREATRLADEVKDSLADRRPLPRPHRLAADPTRH